MSNVQFVIEDSIPIPKREVDFGPRGSQYPIDQMKAGQSFRVAIEGRKDETDKDGKPISLLASAKKHAAQKQSYFSSLGRKHGIKVVTRFFAEDAEYGPHLRVWHDGPRVESDEDEVEEVEGELSDVDLD